MRIVLVPRAPGAVHPGDVNGWLEARDDVTRLDMDAFVVQIGSADVASRAEVFTAQPDDPLESIVVEMETAGTPWGGPLVPELRRFCEELASEFDLVAETSQGHREVDELFDSGAL